MKTLLTGTFLRSLDEKQRLAVPKRLRDALVSLNSTAIYVAPGTDGSLALYPEEAFARLGQQLDRTSPTGHDVRAFSRIFYAQAQRVEIDKQGRIRIPPELAPAAGLRKEIVLIGVRDHLEIWDREKWESYFAEKQNRYDEIAERAFAAQASLPATADPTDIEEPLPTQPR